VSLLLILKKLKVTSEKVTILQECRMLERHMTAYEKALEIDSNNAGKFNILTRKPLKSI